MTKEKDKNKTITNDNKEVKKNKNEETKEKKEKKVVKEEIVSLTKEEIEAMNGKINLLEEKALRAQAELINYRKRKDEELDRKLKYANEDLIIEILPVLDNFERAMKMDDDNLEDEVSQFLSGMKMVYQGLSSALEKFGVKEIESLDKKFDANVHQAVMTESDPNKEKEIILEVYQKGYMLKDKVIRPAMVKVNQ